MLRVFFSFLILVCALGCIRSEEVIPDVVEVTIKEDSSKVNEPVIKEFVRPYPEVLNPTDKQLLVRSETGSIWYGYRVVDTTIYQYNNEGVIEKEFFTTKTGSSFSNFYSVKSFSVIPENLGSSEQPYVIESVSYASGRNYRASYYCNHDGRVERIEISDNNVKEFYRYDSKGRLEEKYQYWHANQSYTTRYKYYSRGETEIPNDYYSEKEYVGKWDENKANALREQNDYIISSNVRNDLKINYPFNFGKQSEYAVEKIYRKILNGRDDNFNRLYSFDFNPEGKVEKKEYVHNNFSFWTKYYYQ